MHPKTRKAAIALLKTVYYTGKPCPKGHDSLRYTLSSACKQCLYEAKAAAQRRISDRFKSVAEGGR